MNRDRLATVVRIRRLQERIARGQVVRDRAAAAERQRAEAAAATLVENASETAPAAASTFIAHRRMLDRGMRDVHVAASAVEAAHGRVAGSLAGWTAAAQELDGVERLDERAVVAAQVEEVRSAAAELDDLVVMRWDR